MFGNILVALKEDGPHDQLFDLAASVAKPNARMHLVTLVRIGTERDEKERLEQVNAYLEGRAEPLRSEGHEVTTESNLIVTSAAYDLIRLAISREADLMVLGLAKRSRVGKALLGSDAQRVMLGAPCPLLVTQLYRDA